MDQYLLTRQAELIHAQIHMLHSILEDMPDQNTIQITRPVLIQSIEDLHESLEELMVTEEELSQQNEELIATRIKLENERKRYQDRFEFAPDAYLETNIEGKILEANSSCAALLNIAHCYLPDKMIISYIAKEERKVFLTHLAHFRKIALMKKSSDPGNNEILGSSKWETCIQPRNKAPIDVGISVTAAQTENGIALRWLFRDNTERKQIEKERKKLLHQLFKVQEEERRNISHELHDQMGQEITALILGLKSLQASITPRDTNYELLKHLQRIADHLGKEVHRVAFEMHPTSLDDLGLRFALSNFAEEWSERSTIHVDFESTTQENRPISPHLATAVYRIVQESFTNIMKHANAQQVSLILDQRPTYLQLVIEDDGCGFDLEEVLKTSSGARHLGLIGMKERTEQVGGTLTIESEIGKGTTIYVRIPLDQEEAILDE